MTGRRCAFKRLRIIYSGIVSVSQGVRRISRPVQSRPVDALSAEKNGPDSEAWALALGSTMPNQLELEVLEQRLNGLMKLLEITRVLAAQHDLGRVLNTVTASACEALACERASLYLYDAEKDELYTRAVTELEIEEIRCPLGSGITGWVARTRKIANIPEPSMDARWNSSIDRRTGFHTANILAVPLIVFPDDRLVGVLQLLNKNNGEFDEFDEQLIQAFAAHAATALERARLLDEARRTQQLEISLDMGRAIQHSFLPETLPTISGYEVAACWKPAEAVSGDYYDVIPLKNGRIGLVVADVSGHGIGPSLMMASARAMLRVLTHTTSDPGQILSTLAETIDVDLRSGRFITMLIASLDPAQHEIVFANAGHGPALHFQRETGRFKRLESTSLPLGFSTDFQIANAPAIVMEPGDLLILGTDGGIELRNAEGDLFGYEGIERAVLAHQTLPARELVAAIMQATQEFHPSPLLPDDVTLLVVERKRHAEMSKEARSAQHE